MNNFLKRNQNSNSDEKKENPIIDFLQSITIALFLSIILFSLITPSEVEGSSMEPNFHTGERVYINRLPQWFSETGIGQVFNLNYSRGDVIVFNKPGLGKSLIKRIIGLPGDIIEIKNGHIYINEDLIIENYIPDQVETTGGTFMREGERVTVDSDSYFVFGDNRPVSEDSRMLGLIKRDWMLGKVVFRIWPFDKLGVISQGEIEFD